MQTYTETLPDGTSFEMVPVPGGKYTIANIKIKLSDFYIGRCAVTQQLWQAVMGNNPSTFQSPRRPLETVNWYDAIEFCNELSRQLGLELAYEIDTEHKDPNNNNDDDSLKCKVDINPGANGYRLPTESEWEYAAAGGSYGRGEQFAGSPNVKEVGWCGVWGDPGGNSERISRRNKLKIPNALGLYDMSGNVYEWCWDWYASNYKEQSSDWQNPQGPSKGEDRVVRGGSWCFVDYDCRVSYRVNDLPDFRFVNIGFRLCRYESRR